MTDPISLTIVSAAVLTEGIKFLYGQAGEALKRWRDQRGKDIQHQKTLSSSPEDLQAFEENLSSAVLDDKALELVEPELRLARRELQDYVEGIELVDPTDETLIRAVDRLRTTMEELYRQDITFRGETRPTSAERTGSQSGVAAAVDSGAVAGRDIHQRGKYVAGRDLHTGGSS